MKKVSKEEKKWYFTFSSMFILAELPERKMGQESLRRKPII